MALTMEQVETIRSLSYRVSTNCEEINNNQLDLLKDIKKNIEPFLEDTEIGNMLEDQLNDISLEIEDLVEKTKNNCKKVNIFADSQKEILLAQNN